MVWLLRTGPLLRDGRVDPGVGRMVAVMVAFGSETRALFFNTKQNTCKDIAFNRTGYLNLPLRPRLGVIYRDKSDNGSATD